MKKTFFATGALVLLGSLAATRAEATVTVFTDRTAWEAAVAGVGVETFESEVAGGTYKTPLTTAGGTSLTSVSGTPIDLQFFDDQTTYLHFRDFTNGLRFTLPGNGNAFGFDYCAREAWTVNANGRAVVLVGRGFVGFVDDAAPIPSLVLTGPVGAQGGIDIDKLSRVGAQFSGLPHKSLGDAKLSQDATGALVITAPASGGEFGVRVDLGEADGMSSHMPLDISEMPVGAYVESRNFGVVDGLPGQLAGTLRITRTALGLEVAPKFDVLNASGFQVRVFNAGKPVSMAGGLPGTLIARGRGRIKSIGCRVKKLPDGGSESFWGIEFNSRDTINVGDRTFGGDKIEIVSQGATRRFESFSHVEMIASGVPRAVVIEERVHLSGFAYASLGGASLEASGGALTASGMDSTGETGLSVDVGLAENVDLDLAPIDPGGTAPVGAFIDANALGELEGTPGQPLGKVRVTKAAQGFDVTADFGDLDSPTQRIQLFRDGQLVVDFPGHQGIVGRAASWPRGLGKLFPNGGLKCYALDWPKDTLFQLDGISRVGDSLRILSEGEPEVGRISELEVRAASLPALTIAEASAVPSGCAPDVTGLCLNNGRFRVEATWRDFQGNTGVGVAVPLTGDTGYFWFFDDDNIELAIKVLDGRPLTDSWWVFFGALSNVEYTITVTDTQTGASKTYSNPSSQFASVGDTVGIADTGTASVSALPEEALGTLDREAFDGYDALPEALAACAGGQTALCLNGSRFQIEVTWRDFQGNTGAGKAVPLTGDTGYFWFFNQANVELVIKVLDGRPVNGKWWVFYGALSNVEYHIRVTDTVTGQTRTYHNPSGTFASRGDTEALPGN